MHDAPRAAITGLALLALTAVPAGAAGELTHAEYTARIVDRKGTATLVDQVTVSGAQFLSCRHGHSKVRVPFTKLQRVRYGPKGSGSLTTVLSLRTGKELTLVCTDVWWIGEASFGRVEISAADIDSVSFQAAAAKICPICHRHYKEAGWRYCPHDGEKLHEPTTP